MNIHYTLKTNVLTLKTNVLRFEDNCPQTNFAKGVWDSKNFNFFPDNVPDEQESKDAGGGLLVKKVQRIVLVEGCKETHKAALQALLKPAAAQITLHATNIPKDICTGPTTTLTSQFPPSLKHCDSSPPTTKRKQAPGSIGTSEKEIQCTPHQLNKF